jgi:hypothetical protein
MYSNADRQLLDPSQPNSTQTSFNMWRILRLTHNSVVVLLTQHDYCAQICSILNSVHSAILCTENVNACYSTNTYLIKYLFIGAEDGTNKQ